MRGTDTDTSQVWIGIALIVFTMTLVMVAHASTAMIFKDNGAINVTHPLLDTTNIPAFLMHSLAYYFACFATTMFLLICAAIILAMATMLMELLAEAFTMLQCLLTERSRRQREEQDATDHDKACYTWNYK